MRKQIYTVLNKENSISIEMLLEINNLSPACIKSVSSVYYNNLPSSIL